MISRSPQYYIPSFVEIGSLVPEKKIFEGFLPYMNGSYLGHVTSIILLIFILMYLKVYIQNLAKNGPVISEKSMF